MKTLTISEDIVPLHEFKAQSARILKLVASNQRPVVITQNGRPAGVVLSPAEYDRMVERQRFLESVAGGLDDLEAGRTLSTDDLEKFLAERRATRERP